MSRKEDVPEYLPLSGFYQLYFGIPLKISHKMNMNSIGFNSFGILSKYSTGNQDFIIFS
jgi:hypothetical protein